MSVSSQTLAMLRRTLGGFLTDTCTLSRETSATDEYGAPTHGTELVASSVPCRLIQLGQRYEAGVAVAGSMETMKEEYRLIVIRDVLLTSDMAVTVNGKAYQIVRIETALTDEAFHNAIVVRRD